MEHTVAGSWSIDIGEHPRVKSAVDFRKNALGDMGKITVGNAFVGNPGNHEGKALLLSNTQWGVITVASLSLAYQQW